MGFRIGSFNVRKLSFATKDEDLQDDRSVRRAYTDIGMIIRNHFDVVAMQEVMNPLVLEQIFQYNTDWDYRWIRSRSKSDDSDEGYAFAWNKKRFRLVAEPRLWVQYRQDRVLGQSGLLRHPFYGRFTTLGTQYGGPACEIRLINTHIRYKPSINKQLPASDIELRKREFSILVEQILNRIADQVADSNGAQIYTLLAGDYNLSLNRNGNVAPFVDEFVFVQDAAKQKRFITVQDKPTTLSCRLESNPSAESKHFIFDGYSKHNYDHFTYDELNFKNRGIRVKTDVIDSVRLYRANDFERHWREISDHIPIVLELSLK